MLKFGTVLLEILLSHAKDVGEGKQIKEIFGEITVNKKKKKKNFI